MRWGMGKVDCEWRNTEGGIKSSEVRARSLEFGVRWMKFGKFSRKILPLFFTILFLTIFNLQTLVFAAEKWAGVDEAVVKKIAKEHGREAREPLINTDQGDLQLFVFLLAGVVGGFVGGYYWRVLMVEKAAKHKRKENESIH